MTDQLWAVLAILLVVLLAGSAALTSGIRRRRRPDRRTDDTGGSGSVATASPETAAPPAGPDAPELDDAGSITTEPAVATPTLERPEPVEGRLVRLRDRLARSGAIGQTLLAVLSRGSLAEEDWEEIEETLLLADVGIGPTTELMDRLRTRVKVLGTTESADVRAMLHEELLDLLDPQLDRTLATTPGVGDDGEPHPATVLVVGVNGTGKTTTVGKLARVLVAEGSSVVLGAADTFRAAAAEQLTTWGERVGVATVRSDREGADPAAVAFDAVRTGRADGIDVVIVDTAGRLHSKAGLMDELGKLKRVISREAPVSEVLLVLDATTGQNGMRQAQVFAEVVDVTGIVLTKLDGTAKGGIVVAVQRELGVPVKLVGLGEGADDLAPFVPEDFVDALLA